MTVNTMQLESLLREALFGLGVMGAVAVCNIYSFAWVTLSYRRSLKQSVLHGQHFEIFRFVGFILLLVLTMLLSLSIWVFALTYFEFAPDWLSSLLFTAGFFTTIGNFSLSMPTGWRLIPSIIAFSGLFSFAWATGSSMSMASNLMQQLEKHKQI